MDFSGKVAVVNGGDNRFGQAVALALANAGAAVGLAGAERRRIVETLALLEPSAAKTRSYVGNLAEPAEAKQCLETLSRELGGQIDVLINVQDNEQDGYQSSAGSRRSPSIQVGLTAIPFLAVGGRLINLTSSVGLLGATGDPVGAIAAGGLIALSKSLAKELAPRQITVNCICLGPVDPTMADLVPMKRPATTDDVIPAVLFLASDKARYVTGLVLSIDGGHSRLP